MSLSVIDENITLNIFHKILLFVDVDSPPPTSSIIGLSSFILFEFINENISLNISDSSDCTNDDAPPPPPPLSFVEESCDDDSSLLLLDDSLIVANYYLKY